jgi:hypothetical protein
MWQFEDQDDDIIVLDESTGEKIVNGKLRLCKVETCYSDSSARGMCGYHYDQKYNKGYRNQNTDKKVCNNSDGKYGFECCNGNKFQQQILESNHIRPQEIGGGDENENSEWLCLQGHHFISLIQQHTKNVIEKESLKGVKDVEKIRIITFRVEETFSRANVGFSGAGRPALSELIHRFYGWYSEANS